MNLAPQRSGVRSPLTSRGPSQEAPRPQPGGVRFKCASLSVLPWSTVTWLLLAPLAHCAHAGFHSTPQAAQRPTHSRCSQTKGSLGKKSNSEAGAEKRHLLAFSVFRLSLSDGYLLSLNSPHQETFIEIKYFRLHRK